MKEKLLQRPLPTEMDDEVPVIDLSGLTPPADALEKKSYFKSIFPGEWVIFPVPGWWTVYHLDGTTSQVYKEGKVCRVVYDKTNLRGPPSYRNLAGQRVTPTKITSLLTQNPSGISTRPASTFHWWKQPDEAYYLAEAKKSLPHFLADTTENFYIVDENSEQRLKFKCPVHGSTGSHPVFIRTDSQQMPTSIGSILIYINPANDQAVWYCPKCSTFNSKNRGGDGKPVKHTIPRDLRSELADADIIPTKEYKHKDRLAEKDKLLVS
ncbi:MAG: hypothetical protein M0Q43_12080, partial [Methanothrix sp.]|nr:hypothetical protein [Methanothrix sp.]